MTSTVSITEMRGRGDVFYAVLLAPPHGPSRVVATFAWHAEAVRWGHWYARGKGFAFQPPALPTAEVVRIADVRRARAGGMGVSQ